MGSTHPPFDSGWACDIFDRIWQKGLYVSRLGHEKLHRFCLTLLKRLLSLKAQSQDALFQETAVIINLSHIGGHI